MTTPPKISIVVPFFKTEKYIKRCLESLINQTFSNIEIICVVAQDTDNSLEICERFSNRDERIIIITQPPKGLASARNEGLLHARGKYIQFCDSDDYFASTMCEKLFNAAEEYGVDIVVSGIKPVSENSFTAKTKDPYYNVPYNGKCNITPEVFERTNVFVWNKLFLTSIIKEYDIKFPDGLYCEDACFLYKYMFVSQTIYYVENSLYFYNKFRPGSLMSDSSTPNACRAMDHVYILNDIYSFIASNKLGKKQPNVFPRIVLTYMSLAYQYGGKGTMDEIFQIGMTLVRNYDCDFDINELRDYNEAMKIYAIRQNNKSMYYWLENQTRTIIKPKDGVISILATCFIFPWYIYRTFCIVYNKPVPKLGFGLFVKVYLFFPYYVLKTYLTMSMRLEQCS